MTSMPVVGFCWRWRSRETPGVRYSCFDIELTDPLGPSRNYRSDAMLDGSTPTTNWADYPALGVDSQAIYVTANMFKFDGGFQYAKIRIIPKSGPYSGGPAPYFDFVRMKNANNSIAFTVQPCHTFGAPQVEYLVNSRFANGNSLTLWQVNNPTGTPTLTRQQVAVSPYTLPQTPNKKEDRPPSTLGTFACCTQCFKAIRYGGFHHRPQLGQRVEQGMELSGIKFALRGRRSSNRVSTAHLACTIFYPACCPDNNGNVTIVFSRSGPSEFGSIRYTGRRATDSLGTLQASTLLKAGSAHYARLDDGGRNRWGDYNGVAAVPRTHASSGSTANMRRPRIRGARGLGHHSSRHHPHKLAGRVGFEPTVHARGRALREGDFLHEGR